MSVNVSIQLSQHDTVVAWTSTMFIYHCFTRKGKSRTWLHTELQNHAYKDTHTHTHTSFQRRLTGFTQVT